MMRKRLLDMPLAVVVVLYLAAFVVALVLLSGCSEYRPVNPGARCEIYTGIAPDSMAHMMGHDTWDSNSSYGIRHIITGLWTRHYSQERIYVAGQVGPGGWVLLHEMEHHYEWALRQDPQAIAIIRHAFLAINPDALSIGGDLRKEIKQ